jgi:hypothetical protein
VVTENMFSYLSLAEKNFPRDRYSEEKDVLIRAFISQIKAIFFVSFDNLINSSSILPKGSSEDLRLTTNNKTSPIMEVKKI